MNRDPEAIRHEARIVWTEDVDRFDYVRETLTTTASTRQRPVPWNGPGRRVGYSVLKSNAPSNGSPGKFTRRVFWVKEHDRSECPDGVYKKGTPSEGVDPRTIASGIWGELTDRAWGSPLPSSSGTPRPPQSAGPTEPGSSRAGAASADESRDVEQDAKKSFADWLHLHEVSAPEALGAAVGEEFKRWLWANSEEMIAAIADAVAKQTAPPQEQPPSA
ncbi:DUF6009 family protein [Streptomyces jumonjinensis]|uniref:DUF6009 family protein n=1 Tax=Streptomyces jumonjinensis TaxID=1945 RepID=UPI0037B976F2